MFMATMLKRDTAAVMQCIRAANPGRDGRSALCIIVEQVSCPSEPCSLSSCSCLIVGQWLNEVAVESLSKCVF